VAGGAEGGEAGVIGGEALGAEEAAARAAAA
jgi:hypothetical protein